MNSLKTKSLYAFFWAAINKGSAQFVNFVVFIVLARILSPDDFGIVALVSVYISILNILIEQGASVVIIQRKNISVKGINTVYTLSFLMSILLLILGSLLSNKIASIFNLPQMGNLFLVANFILIIGPFYNISSAIVRKKLDFKSLAISSFIGISIAGLVAIILAIKGFGLWSLIAKLFIETLIITALLFRYSKWIPKLIISKKELIDIYKSSSFVFGVHAIKLLSRRSLDFLIGYYLGVTQLGYFDIASKFYNSLNSILAQIISSVALPLFSKVQSDKNLVKIIYNKLLRYSLIIPVPLYTLCILLASPLILFFFGEKWVESIYISQVLCGAGILLQLQTINETLIFSKDKMSIKFFQELMKVVLTIGLFFLLYEGGLTSVSWIVFVGALFAYSYDLIVTQRILELSILKQLKNNLHIILSIFFTSCITFLIGRELNMLSSFSRIVFNSLIFYIGLITMLYTNDSTFQKEFQAIILFIKNKSSWTK